jgi:hypothetical protein
VRRQLERDRLRQGHVAHLPPLGRREQLPAADELDLPADVHHAAQEVDVLDRQPEDLALPQAAAGRQGGHRPVAVGQRLPDSATCSIVHGTTLPCGAAGGLTDDARHGLRTIRSSSTAAASTADRLARMTRT